MPGEKILLLGKPLFKQCGFRRIARHRSSILEPKRGQAKRRPCEAVPKRGFPQTPFRENHKDIWLLLLQSKKRRARRTAANPKYPYALTKSGHSLYQRRLSRKGVRGKPLFKQCGFRRIARHRSRILEPKRGQAKRRPCEAVPKSGFPRNYSFYAQYISPGSSNIITSCMKRMALLRPSSPLMRPSSCSMDTGPS